jgi:DNA-binding NarL/FixJ family response regulator
MARTISVAVSSASRLWRETIAACLAREDGITLVGAARSVYDLVVRPEARPTEVLLCYHPNVAVSEAQGICYDAKFLLPAARVIVLGFEEDAAGIGAWIEAGAVAYLEHDAPYQRLTAAIRAAASNQSCCSREVFTWALGRIKALSDAPHSQEPPPRGRLTDREREIGRLLALDFKTKAIARRLGIAPATVQAHTYQVLKKLGLRRRARLIFDRLQFGGAAEWANPDLDPDR